jgi:hypothetical protein
LAGAVTLDPFIGDRRAGDIAVQVLQLLALIEKERLSVAAFCPL